MFGLRLLLTSLVLLALVPGSRGAAGATAVRLLLPVEAAKPGDSFVAGVEFELAPGWHNYWRNGGDSGAPSSIEWTLPPGVTAGPIRWPAPEKAQEQDLITYIYQGTVTLLVPLSIAPDAPPGEVEIAGSVRWLECKEQCLPRKAPVRASLRIGPESRPSANAALVQAAEAKLPKPLPAGTAEAAWEGPATGETRPLVIRWKAAGEGIPEFFHDANGTYDIPAATELLPAANGVVSLRKSVKRLEAEWPERITGVLARLDVRGRPLVAFEATLPIADAFAGAPAAAPAAAGSGPMSAITRLSLGRALFLGLIGGMILNIMPCVLPVIALKILGFVRQSGSRPAEIRKLGLIYGLGVWFSFLVLAGVVIAVKQATGAASWGMQFGNPIFLVAMTALVLLVSLSLFGVYEINLAGGAMDAAGELASKEGPAGAFFNGMLAVALATPCTAPFLAPALGYAFAAQPLTIVLVFSAVAVGLAAPYVVLSWQPAWLKFLPKPGAWMEHFKIAMGFPMLATTVWLYSLAADYYAGNGHFWLGLFLVALGLATWIWGQFVQRGRRRQTAAMVAAALVVATAYAVALENELDWRHPASPETKTSGPTKPASADHLAWEPWSPEAIASGRQAGRPVFVDFTANWCAICELNLRSSIDIPAVRKKLREINALVLKGDHTRTPANITAELLRFGRAGVPLVLVYPADTARDPIVLPELLSPGLVLDALDRAAKR